MNTITITHHHIAIPKHQKVLKANQYQTVYNSLEIIEAAKEHAVEIEKAAQDMFEAEKKRGFEEGLMESKIEQAEQMLKMVDRTINYLSEIEGTMADILMSAIKKIIEGFDNNAMIIGLIKSALHHVRNQHEVVVRVPPAQYQHVKESVNDILIHYKGVGFINPVSDPRLSAGQCILESKIGVIDASIDLQLEALKRQFSKVTNDSISALNKSIDIFELPDDPVIETKKKSKKAPKKKLNEKKEP
ncbi:MAG: HrpE/YscL family type III secretion apparatus protein [Endozoicomonadaceae bacterium]|nr:HrpE/YscL family type III secretion apparatus protein [Endozoicomonadaceae bacterium]MBE8232895.1 HrpE/YscL family type III secretion apparatus protein [Endozoicomonadaceae bacterium]